VRDGSISMNVGDGDVRGMTSESRGAPHAGVYQGPANGTQCNIGDQQRQMFVIAAPRQPIPMSRNLIPYEILAGKSNPELIIFTSVSLLTHNPSGAEMLLLPPH
jgi:hypothetical protein